MCYFTAHEHYSKASNESGKIGGKDIADDAIVFVKDTAKDEYKVVSGATLKNTSAATVKNAYYNSSKTTGFDTIVLAYVESAMASTTDVKYGYVVADVISSKNDDDATIATVKFWDGSSEVTLKTDKDNATVLSKKGQAFTYKLDANGDMTSIVKITSDKEHAVTAYNGTKLGGQGWSNTYDVDKDTVIIYVDTDAKTGVDGGSITLANKDEHGNYIKNVLTWADSDGDIVYIFVDIANDFQFVS